MRSSVPFPRPVALALLVSAALLNGCANLEDNLNAASRRIDSALSGVTRALAGSEERFKEARALDARGRDVEAVEIYRSLADEGHAEAAYEMGEAYETGSGVAKNAGRAAEYYNRSANLGSARGQFLVGRAYAEGAGVPKDLAKAAAYFGKAAVQGYAPAQYRLGRAFANGDGVPKDVLWACRWYGKAGRQGVADAQLAYGALLAWGVDVPKNLPLGHAYLTAAANGGNDTAKGVLARIEATMTPQQLAEAASRYRALNETKGDGFADPPTVWYAQAALAKIGIDPGPVDGLIGASTRAGIRTFQRRQDMSVTGELDPRLIEELLQAARA